MNQLTALLHLQETDDQIQSGKQRLREVLLAQKGSSALQQAQQRHASAEAALSQLRTRQKALEQQINQLGDKQKRSSDRLYSGKVTNPKELADLQHEIEALTRRRGELEDDLLELMIELEPAEAEHAQALAAKNQEEQAWAVQKEALSREQDELATDLNALLEKRKKQTAAIDAKFLTAYENTRQKRGGIAVAVVHDGLCQACGVRVSSSKVSLANSGALARCGSCDRIIVNR